MQSWTCEYWTILRRGATMDELRRERPLCRSRRLPHASMTTWRFAMGFSRHSAFRDVLLAAIFLATGDLERTCCLIIDVMLSGLSGLENQARAATQVIDFP
jgi:hypothetical protein